MLLILITALSEIYSFYQKKRFLVATISDSKCKINPVFCH